MLDAKDIKEIIQLIDRSSFKKMKLEYGECTLDLQKDGAEPTATDSQADKTEDVREEVVQIEREDTAPKEATDTETITSTMVGTFYFSSEPEDEPYVTVGDHVKADTVVGVVEAMKLFNEVEAGVEGEVTDVLVESGALVEHGQPLFNVKKV